MQYLLLIYENEAEAFARPESEQAQYIQDFGTFTQQIIQSGHMKAGEALVPVSEARSVRVRNGEMAVSQGPFAETHEALGGFYMVEAADMDEACEIAARIPTSRYGTIEVRPVMVWNEDGTPQQ